MGVFQSGQMGQTVNLLSFDFGGSNPSAPTKKEICNAGLFFVINTLFYLFSLSTIGRCVAPRRAVVAQWAPYACP